MNKNRSVKGLYYDKNRPLDYWLYDMGRYHIICIYLKQGTMENESSTSQCSLVQAFQADVQKLWKSSLQFYDDLLAVMVLIYPVEAKYKYCGAVRKL